MKKIIFLTVSAFFLCGSLAFGGDINLVGIWEYTQDCVRIGDSPDYDYDFYIETAQIEIEVQQGNLFTGGVVGGEVPNQLFYGAIDGKNVYFTFWDGFANGTINSKGTEMSFVSQNPLNNPPNAPGTCIGTAIKVFE